MWFGLIFRSLKDYETFMLRSQIFLKNRKDLLQQLLAGRVRLS
jgi:hypothetical protein